MTTFALDVGRFVAKAKAAPGKVLGKVGIDLGKSVVMGTPVGNPTLWKSKAPAGYVGGRLRANWNPSIGTPDLSTGAGPDKSGSRPILRATAVFSAAQGDSTLYLMNSMPYVRAIEYEGHSQQAPAGMVRVTVSQFQRFVDKAVRSLPK